MNNLIIELYNKYYDQYFVLLPFFMALGVITFAVIPPVIPVPIGLIIVCAVLSIYLFSSYLWQILLMPIILFTIGILVASLHNNYRKSVCFTGKNMEISAKIERIVYGGRPYFFGSVVEINKRPINCKVKINYLDKSDINVYDVNAGDTISFIGSLNKPMPPIFPRVDKIYIEKINGKILTANITSNAQIIKRSSLGFFDKIRSKVANKINIVSDHGTKSGYGIIAALTIGNTGYITDETLDNIRKSGFAHLLAISGLHLGTIIGFVFIIVRWALSFTPYICLRFNTKKIAALIAIIVSFCYLQIANGSISVHRSFIMCSLLLVGVILDRKAIMLRIWGIALFYVVIFMPDKIFMPSMQMSFVATFTLIAVYQKFSKKDDILILTNKNGLLFYIFTIFLSSFIAGFTTMFYEAYHFGQWSMIGLVSNELAIPIAEFLLLPLSMIAILFTGTFIGDYLYKIASFFGEILAALANFFANQKFSYILLKAMPPSSILLITIGLYIIFITLNKWSSIGIFFILIAMLLHFMSPKPIFVIDSRGKQIFYMADDQKYYINKEIESQFVKRIFSQELAQKDFSVEQNSKNWICSTEYCKYNNKVCLILSGDNDYSGFNNIIDLRKSAKKSNNTITGSDLRKSGTILIY